MKSDGLLVASIVLLFFLGTAAGFKSGTESATKKFKTELVERGLAEYNSTNGVWQYKK